jgi:hypothetical protein
MAMMPSFGGLLFQIVKNQGRLPRFVSMRCPMNPFLAVS